MDPGFRSAVDALPLRRPKYTVNPKLRSRVRSTVSTSPRRTFTDKPVSTLAETSACDAPAARARWMTSSPSWARRSSSFMLLSACEICIAFKNFPFPFAPGVTGTAGGVEASPLDFAAFGRYARNERNQKIAFRKYSFRHEIARPRISSRRSTAQPQRAAARSVGHAGVRQATARTAALARGETGIAGRRGGRDRQRAQDHLAHRAQAPARPSRQADARAR